MPAKEYKPLHSYQTAQEKADAVRQAMRDGHTNKSAADALKTTPGTIAGIRRDHDIPPRKKIRAAEIKPDLPRPQVAPAPVDTTAPVKMQLAVFESEQCEEMIDPRFRCASVRLPGSTRCERHQLSLKR